MKQVRVENCCLPVVVKLQTFRFGHVDVNWHFLTVLMFPKEPKQFRFFACSWCFFVHCFNLLLVPKVCLFVNAVLNAGAVCNCQSHHNCSWLTAFLWPQVNKINTTISIFTVTMYFCLLSSAIVNNQSKTQKGLSQCQ